MRVLFLGSEESSSTSRHRAEAFRRLGHQVHHLDPLQAFAPRLAGNLGRLHYHTGYRLLRAATAAWLAAALGRESIFDVCWVDGGEMIGAEAARTLKGRCGRVILFNHDDPTGPRDWGRFATLRSAVPEYDLCAVVRPINVAEFQALGAKKVLHVFRTYDEVAHAPPIDGRPVPAAFQSDICFIGANYKGEGRDEFLAGLISRGLDVAIWGDHWERSRHWKRLERHRRGGNLSGKDYVDAIRGAKLCIGFLSKKNRDEHTTRSMEIPFAGGLLFAERTVEHKALYNEGIDAAFWSDGNECYEVATALFADGNLRESLRRSGTRRVKENQCGNENLICRLLNEKCR